MQATMVLIWAGSLLVLAGVLVTAANALWRGRLTEVRRAHPDANSNTLEPRGKGSGFGKRGNWLGLGLLAVGCLLLLAAAAL
jgi:hypothetical protein